jgi:hypothetical protein
MKHHHAIGLWALAMIVATPVALAQDTSAPASPPASETACQPGVYLVGSGNGSPSLLPIAENFTDRRKLGNMLGGMLFAGFSSMKIQTVVLGARASVRTNVPKPQFKFCFAPAAPLPQNSSNSGSAYVGTSRTALSPKEYSLVRFDAKDDSRLLSVGKVKMSGVQGAIPDSAVRFSVTQESTSIFYVTPDQALSPGEYGFFHSAAGASTSLKNKNKDKSKIRERVFDFGID